MKRHLTKTLLSCMETMLLLLPAGPLLFYPFLLQYGFMDAGSYLYFGGLIAIISGTTACLLVFLPTTLLFFYRSQTPGTRELAAMLSLILLLGVIGVTILHKGMEPAGEAGKPLLFGLVLYSILSAWVYALRFKKRLDTSIPQA